MIQEEKFTVLRKASIRPSKIVFYNQFIRNHPFEKTPSLSIDSATKEELQKWGVLATKQVQPNSHNFQISQKASKNIQEKVSWLYELSKPKTIVLENKKVIGGFKMNFITLTLPSEQKHPTAVITKECLNQFLTEMSQKFNLQNYVWRLEFQKNGNVHYHICTDKFLEYTTAKLCWNRCLSKLGYIRAYTEKMEKLSFSEYRKLYDKGGTVDFNLLRERYGRGVATRWDSPNTVDVKNVGNAKNIAFYVSKYITKSTKEAISEIVSAREPSSTNLRLWFCSRSLSKLKAIEYFIDENLPLVEEFISKLSSVRKYIFDYCVVWYYEKKAQAIDTLKTQFLLFREHAKLSGYVSG